MLIFRCPNCSGRFDGKDSNICPECNYASDETLHAMSVKMNRNGTYSYEWRTEFVRDWIDEQGEQANPT